MVVLKRIVKKKVLADCWTVDARTGRLPLEIAILHRTRQHPHPNIVKMTRAFQDRHYFFIEMALHGAGRDLFDYIEFNPGMSENEIRFIFKQACLAIQHLHKLKVVHRGIFLLWG
jgi:serine/threonine protein kinase